MTEAEAAATTESPAALNARPLSLVAGWARDHRLADLQSVVVFGALYLIALLSSERLYSRLEVPSPFWLPDSVLLCALLLTKRKQWWMLLLAVWPVRLLVGAVPSTPAWFVVFGIVNDSLKAMLAVWWLESVVGRPVRLATLREFTWFLAIVCAAVPLLSALAAAPARHLLGDPLWSAAHHWFLGNALTQVIVTPMLLYWGTAYWRQITYSRTEVALLVSSLLAVLYYTFVIHHTDASPAVLYVPVPFLIWAAVRFGAFGAANALTMTAIVAMAGTVRGAGMFTGSPASDSVLELQLFLGVLAVSLLSLAILKGAIDSKTNELRESEQRFRVIAGSAPTMIWMSGTDKGCTFVNQSCCDFMGRSLADALGGGWMEGVHPDDREACFATYCRCFDARTPFAAEYRFRRHDNEYRWVTSVGVPRTAADGTFSGYIGSSIDITERKIAEFELQELSGRLIDAQEQERTRIARELHDDFGQRMAVVQMTLEQMAGQSGVFPAKTLRQLRAVSAEVAALCTNLHDLSHQLHPATLGMVGLVPALQGLCGELHKQHGVNVEFVHSNMAKPIPMDVRVCIYRVAQEALRNVAKHSAACYARMELMDRVEHIELRITDDGAGFVPESTSGKAGLGLVSMRERLRVLGGQLSVQSAPAQGTRVQMSVPISRS